MKRNTEKRIHPRRRYEAKVVFEDENGDGLFYLKSSDISMGGLFLKSNIPIWVGSMVLLSLKLPKYRRAIRVTGQIVRRSVSDDNQRGVGLRFVGLSDLAKKRLAEFLA